MSPVQQTRLLLAIFVAVLVWGGYHAVGAYLLNRNPYRPLVVMACVGGYLLVWGLLLRQRQARRPRDVN